MQVAGHTRPEDRFKATDQLFFHGPLPPTPWAETGLPPFEVRRDIGLGYHPSEAWLVGQKALPLKLFLKQSGNMKIGCVSFFNGLRIKMSIMNKELGTRIWEYEDCWVPLFNGLQIKMSI